MGKPTNVYYAKPELFREVVMGWEFLKGINHPVIERLVKHDLT